MRHWSSRPVLVAGAVLLVLAAGGCSRIHSHQGFLAENLIVDSILPGVDNKDSVQAALGRPTFASQFGPERWYYVSRDTKQLAFGSPVPTGQLLLTIQFDQQGNVAKVSHNTSLAQVAKIKPYGPTTPTLGRKHGLFQEIFGNIGTIGAGGGGPGEAPTNGPNGS